jgi:hypothetical protein
MNERAFDRIAEAYMADGPTVLPDRVLDAALDEVHLTRQRRSLARVPWRYPLMNTYAKIALAAVVVIALGAVGLAIFRPGSSPNVGGPPAASPTPSAAPTASPTPSPTPAPTAPSLTGRFTSDIHGLSIAYPETWSTRAATTPWTSGLTDFGSESADVLYDASIPAHLWLSLGSRPLGDLAPDDWAAEVGRILAADEPDGGVCPSTEPVTIDGAPGTTGCQSAIVTAAGRGYLILLYTSGDEPWLDDTYDEDWFKEVLATVQLDPESAVDAPAP